MSPQKPVDAQKKGEESAPETKPNAALRDPALAAEIAIELWRATTLADDGEWIHQDAHFDLSKRHVDAPAVPHTDRLYTQHLDVTFPHHDSLGVGPGPRPPRPKRVGPHTDITRGHLDSPPRHVDHNVGDHQDYAEEAHGDYMAEPSSSHVDQFVGHQDEGTKDPEPTPTPDPGRIDT